MSDQVLVSVVIPVFNREEMALDAVRSVVAQHYQPIEIIVVDDGSDVEPVLLKELLDSVGGRFIRIDHRGVSAARNVGINLAQGEWVALLDSDDLWLPEKLSQQMSYVSQNSEIKICQVAEIWFRGGVFVNPKQRHKMPHGEAFYRSLELCCISASSVVLHKTLFEEFGLFREELPICEDYDLWLRLSAKYEIASLEQGLVEKYGARDDQLSRSQRAQDRFRVYAILCLLRDVALTPEKRSAALNTLRQKCEVLQNGAIKRDEQQRVAIYAAILDFVNSQFLQTEIDKLVMQMQSEISRVIV